MKKTRKQTNKKTNKQFFLFVCSLPDSQLHSCAWKVLHKWYKEAQQGVFSVLPGKRDCIYIYIERERVSIFRFSCSVWRRKKLKGNS